MSPREVVVVGAGIAGTAAALAAARKGAEVTVIRGGGGASALSSGALDVARWELANAEASALSGEADAVLEALGAFVVGPEAALVATTAGVLRPARGLDRALLDLRRASGKTVLVARSLHEGWDADALARAWNASPLGAAGGVRFVVMTIPLLRDEAEHRLSDAELATRHDDPSRVAWLTERLREASLGNEGHALLLPPWLGVDREVASALTEAVGVPCGEALGGVGGPSGLRFERARDRALLAARIHVLDARATRIGWYPEQTRPWRAEVASPHGGAVECQAVVLATGGVLGGGIEYTPSGAVFGTALPTLPGHLARLTCEAPGALGARGVPLQDPSSLFGAAPESHAWPHVDEPLLDCLGLLTDADGRVLGAPEGLYASGELVADRPHAWLSALASGARAGAAAAGSS